MIKNLLNADEDPPEGTKVIIEDSVVNVPANAPAEDALPTKQTAFEVPEDAQFFVKVPPTGEEKAEFEQFSAAFDDVEEETQVRRNFQTADETSPEENLTEIARENAASGEYDELLAQIEKEEPEIFNAREDVSEENLGASKAQTVEEVRNDYAPAGTLFQSDYAPPTTAQTIRDSGLAWSAGVVLFGSVIFMMIFGWFADLLLGSSPWGLVGGIILGGLIGIVQLFRITSQIHKK